MDKENCVWLLRCCRGWSTWLVDLLDPRTEGFTSQRGLSLGRSIALVTLCVHAAVAMYSPSYSIATTRGTS